MAEPGEEHSQAFRRFEAALLSLQERPITGDLSLDSFLVTQSDETVRWLQNLAVPHWIDRFIAAALSPPEGSLSEGARERALTMPFVREHPRGLAFHDAARAALRNSLIGSDQSRYRDVCRRTAAALRAPAAGDADEEVLWERVYCQLAFAEEEGVTEFRRLFLDALEGRRFSACHQLVTTAEEQWPFLSESARDHIKYFSGLLAFESRDFVSAEAAFRAALENGLPEQIRLPMQLYLGRILEAREAWGAAIAHYGKVIEQLPPAPSGSSLAAQFCQRMAAAELALGRLDRAEEHLRESLQLNQAAEDPLVTALDYNLLGEINRRLGDAQRAEEYLTQSAKLLRENPKHIHQLPLVLNNLARLHLDRGDLDAAERTYREAMELRTAAGDNFGLGLIYSDLGRIQLRRNDFDGAIRYYETALKILREFRDQQKIAQVQRAIAGVLYSARRLPEAIARLEEAITTLPPDSGSRDAFATELSAYRNELAGQHRSWWRRHGWGMGLGVVVAGGLLLIVIGIIYVATWRQLDVKAGGSGILVQENSMSTGESHSFELELLAGRRYHFRARCDFDCSNLDLELVTASGESVAADLGTSSEPELEYAATASGRYRLEVRMTRCTADPCGYKVVTSDMGPSTP